MQAQGQKAPERQVPGQAVRFYKRFLERRACAAEASA